MVNPILAGSIAFMISSGAAVFVAPHASAVLDVESDGWCGSEAEARAHAKTRRHEAEARASARAARWLCHGGADDGRDLRPHDEAGGDEECEEHGTRHRERAEAHARVEAHVSVDVGL